MKDIRYIAGLLIMFLQVTAADAGDTVVCDAPGEQYVGWPTADPVWEMCYLAPNNSSAAQGSSLEIRHVHYNGLQVLERSHVPMLFANYASGTCYRDWKDTNSSFLRADQVENPTRPAITTCDISVDEDLPVGNCPFQDVSEGGSGSVGNGADCFTGVQVEKYADRLVLTTNHSAAWYKYTARYIFYLDGRFQPRFGFGNSDGTNAPTTHWHHAYWRLNFDIDGADNDEVFIDDGSSQVQQTVEFSDFREITSGQPNDPGVYSDEVTWLVKDSVTGRGYQMVPGFEGDSQQGLVDDYAVPPDPGMDQYHNIDVMVSNYKLINGSLPEYSDTPGSNSLFDCDMSENAIVDGDALTGVDGNPVFWYRTAVEDIGNQGMICKTGGPTFYPVGDWSNSQAPSAVADTATVTENTTDNAIDVTSNDTDIDGGPKFVASVEQPNNGLVQIDAPNNVLYTPNQDYCNEGAATDDFEYTLNGGSTAMVQVTVECVDSMPVAVADAFTTDRNVLDAVIDVVNNDTDVDGGPKYVESVTQPANGSVVIGVDGAFVEYTPDLDYCNDGQTTDDFDYSLNGGSTGTVAVTVNCSGVPDLIFADDFE